MPESEPLANGWSITMAETTTGTTMEEMVSSVFHADCASITLEGVALNFNDPNDKVRERGLAHNLDFNWTAKCHTLKSVVSLFMIKFDMDSLCSNYMRQ